MQSGCRACVIAALLPMVLPAMLAILGTPALADDEPTIAKDSIRTYVTTASCNFGERGCEKNTSFLNPYIEFKVNGPVASGSQLSVEFTVPGRPPRKWDCPTREKRKGELLETECGSKGGEGDRGFAFQGPVYTGPVTFNIHMRNEVQGTNASVFAGKMKVGKTSSKNPNEITYYVDEDWRIPIGYIFLVKAENNNGSGGPGTSMFHALLWFRGTARDVEAHVLYQGKEVGKSNICSAAATRGNNMWKGYDCHFDHVYNLSVPQGWPDQGIHLLTKNPGEYEIKVLAGGHLTRSIKFTVDQNGKFDNGIATANMLGSDKVIVPVQVLGVEDGTWNKAAWKTDAFYGNPLSGFTAVP
ncbi:MAG TPA: hypothetical protein VKV95_19645 [Terriglobia bacterium]|nr:hypothetical protein [Terriglobia bacterium]